MHNARCNSICQQSRLPIQISGLVLSCLPCAQGDHLLFVAFNRRATLEYRSNPSNDTITHDGPLYTKSVALTPHVSIAWTSSRSQLNAQWGNPAQAGIAPAQKYLQGPSDGAVMITTPPTGALAQTRCLPPAASPPVAMGTMMMLLHLRQRLQKSPQKSPIGGETTREKRAVMTIRADDQAKMTEMERMIGGVRM